MKQLTCDQFLCGSKMLIMGKNTFKFCGIVYKICMETKIQ